ncbi:MAG: hypothetical protein MUO40_00525 [Anaerolineaceae bacterium]|nr:hypothetical protein [Anaerolineaceae bacterium]
MTDRSLDFYGPFSFGFGPNYLFTSEFAKKEGVYLWVIKDTKNDLNYIEYVGETYNFAKRQKEHLVAIIGLSYRIINANSARMGELKIVWNGLWRDKSSEGVGKLLEIFPEVSKYILDYVSLIDIYFAPTSFETYLRKHVEGCIGWNLRNKYSQYKTFYPDDNHIGTMPTKLNEVLTITSQEPILGLDRELLI